MDDDRHGSGEELEVANRSFEDRDAIQAMLSTKLAPHEIASRVGSGSSKVRPPPGV